MTTQGKCRKYGPQWSVFYMFFECSQMPGVFYHSVIHGLGFFICFMIKILHAQNNKTLFFYVFYGFSTNQSACRVLSMF